jgi:SOS response regulatory protein OraA/RecX
MKQDEEFSDAKQLEKEFMVQSFTNERVAKRSKKVHLMRFLLYRLFFQSDTRLLLFRNKSAGYLKCMYFG